MHFSKRAVVVGSMAAGLALTAGLAGAASHSNGVDQGAIHYSDADATQGASFGYFANVAPGGEFTHEEGWLGTNGQTGPLQQLKIGGTNAEGFGLCAQTGLNEGRASQVGVAPTSATTKEVIFGVGNLQTASGAWGSVNFADPCADGSLATAGNPDVTPTALLSGIPIADTVVIQMLYNSAAPHNGCGPGRVLFAAEDETANPGVWVDSSCEPVGSHVQFNEADLGVVSDEQNAAGTADQYAGTAAHVGLSANINGRTVHGSFQSDPNWTVFPVEASSNGLSSGTVLGTEDAFTQDHTDFFVSAGTGS